MRLGLKWKYVFAVCVVTFEPIRIQTCSSQNDHLNLRFVKDIKVFGKKPTRYGHKMDFCQLQRPFMSRKFDAPPSTKGFIPEMNERTK